MIERIDSVCFQGRARLDEILEAEELKEVPELTLEPLNVCSFVQEVWPALETPMTVKPLTLWQLLETPQSIVPLHPCKKAVSPRETAH